MNKNFLGVGLIGCGTFCPAYLSTLGSVFKNVRVDTCSDLYLDKARETAEKFGIPRACTTEELLADSEVDIALILTTPQCVTCTDRTLMSLLLLDRIGILR